jgi:hypothetical protein
MYIIEQKVSQVFRIAISLLIKTEFLQKIIKNLLPVEFKY